MWESAKTTGNPFQRSERFVNSELPDPLSYRRPDGTILRLPNYSPGTAFVEVDQRSGFQIRAKPLFPLVRSGDTGTIALPRFLLQIRFGGTLAMCVVTSRARRRSFGQSIEHGAGSTRNAKGNDSTFCSRPRSCCSRAYYLVSAGFFTRSLAGPASLRSWLAYPSPSTPRPDALALQSPLHWPVFIGIETISAVAGL